MSEQLNAALRERLDTLEKFWAAGDARSIVDQLYAANTQITGPGSDPVVQGTEQLTELVSSLVEGASAAKIRIDHTQPLGDSAAYTWVTWEVVPKDGDVFNMKSLFIWQRTFNEWRLIADMYAEGEISF
ncbi:DUF4440 domain-containing protein [Pseudomonas sp. NPDC089758]|uniref:DUF4440 domain-containing protein n=1 Tax=Pseudomonas sp. NPDC089758 TaxID=3364473 RepID=UPI003810A259